jgi:hypothetical protein
MAVFLQHRLYDPPPLLDGELVHLAGHGRH